MKVVAKIHSLNGELGEVTIQEKIGDNDYKVDYNGISCHAIFNCFVGYYFVDDLYGIIE